MKTKYWRAPATQNGTPIALYVASTDKLISLDLEVPDHASLINNGRSLRMRREQSDDTNHEDFAVGALDAYRAYRPFANVHVMLNKIAEVACIPPGLLGESLGGTNGTFLATVYLEEATGVA